MKKSIFSGVILTLLFMSFSGSSMATVPMPDVKYVVNDELKQCAIAKFKTKLPSSWKIRDAGSFPHITDSFLAKDLSFRKDVCDNGYLYFRHDADDRYDIETYFKEPMDYTRAETFRLNKYNTDIKWAVNTETGECNIAIDDEVRDRDLMPRIIFEIRKEARDKINQHFISDEYKQRAFCEDMGYNFIGILDGGVLNGYKKLIAGAVLSMGGILAIVLVAILRKKLPN